MVDEIYRLEDSSFVLSLFYSTFLYSKISDTEQFKIKHKVSNVFVVMASPFFIRCMVLAEIPCLKMSSYSVTFFLKSVS